MITVHEENHLGTECRKLTKGELKYGMFNTLEDFIEHVETGFYSQHDCDGRWACVDSEGVKYCGDSVQYDQSGDGVEFINKPEWATHVFWSSK